MPVDDEWPPHFTLDQERILHLLTGDRFYSNASAALREAILNAIDALARRQATDPSLQGKIIVTFHRDELTLTVEDNGDGMSRDEVTALFTTIGASASQLSRPGARPVGEFGIGIVSYFMASDRFDLETFVGQGEPIGLSFHKEMFAGGQATQFRPARDTQGTTLRLVLRDVDTYQLLLESFPHWCRGVDGLAAFEFPDRPLTQGDYHDDPARMTQVELPVGIEKAALGPIAVESAWEVMPGHSEITILYRGIFVQDYAAKRLWGMAGSIHVDPKHFKPKLNREGFVGEEFGAEIDSFLRASHPAMLTRLADALGRAFEEGRLDRWNARQWATLWLSVPRDASYADASARWDDVFRRVPAFELGDGSKWIQASVNDLTNIGDTIFVAPQPSEKQDDLIKSATRFLRETGRPVLRGVARDRNLLRGAGNFFATTADLISNQFKDELPELRMIADNAESILGEVYVLRILYGSEHPVELVELGEDAPPLLRVGRRLLINTTIDAGRAFVIRAVEVNRGRRGLIEVAAEIGVQYLTSVAAIARAEPVTEDEIFGLVERRFLRGLVS